MFGENSLPYATPIFTALACYGAYRITKGIYKSLKFLGQHSLRSGSNVWQKYQDKSKDSFVVVTGGSDGCGLEICNQLADQGANICIIARNEEKIKEKLNQIQKKGVKTSYFVADFAEMNSYEDYEKLAEKMKSIDIGMVFLNAGIGEPGPFVDLDTQRMERIVKLNVCHPMYLTRALLPTLLKREYKSAIVVTGSGLGARPVAAFTTYSATKAAAMTFAEALSYEVGDKVDVMAWVAGEM